MRYASIGILAIILHLIINRQQLGKIASGTEMTDPERKVAPRQTSALRGLGAVYAGPRFHDDKPLCSVCTRTR